MRGGFGVKGPCPRSGAALHWRETVCVKINDKYLGSYLRLMDFSSDSILSLRVMMKKKKFGGWDEESGAYVRVREPPFAWGGKGAQVSGSRVWC